MNVSRKLSSFSKKLLVASASFCLFSASADNVTLYQSFAGNMNFVTAGGTLRTGADGTGNQCNVTNGPVTGAVSGIPAGATIEAAFLYWAGSGTTIDSAVTFNGNNVTADRTFTETYNLPPLFTFFGGVKDVKAFITGNGTYSFSNLTVATGDPWCASSGVVSGWALIVIYSHPSEDFRVVNVFDGLQQFRGSSITLTPNNFVIPSSPINGKFSIVTWEGDVGNSADLGGFSEDISLNGTDLVDGANPLGNQFNSTINTYGTGNTYYGADIDTYNISSFLSAGNTSVTTTYSSGGDLVLLAAEVISVTNTPVSDLSISKSHTGNFSVNTNGVYTLNVTNNGPLASTGTITVTDTLPTGIGFVSATGTGWSCSFSTPTVTCTRSGTLADAATTPNITLTVSVGNAAFPSVTNTATVTGPNFDNVSGNNTVSDPTTVLGPDLSTSTKTFVDVNGGEADVGDTIRYTITINNTSTTAAASGVSVTDDIPALTSGFSVVSTPVGSTNSSTFGGTGANGTGFLNITNISIPANGSVTVVFNVTIAVSANPNDSIDNSATITTPAGTGAIVDAPTITVSPSLIPTTGTKLLYFAIPSGGTQYVQRAIPVAPATTNTVIVNGASANTNFALNPVLAGPLTIGAGNQNIVVNIACNNQCGGAQRSRSIRVDLQHGTGGTWTTIGTNTQTYTLGAAAVYSARTHTVNVASNVTVPSGNQVRVLITNTTGNAGRRVQLIPLNAGNYARVELNALTVINVDSIDSYTATYPSVATTTEFAQGATAYLRAVVSDPFGSADITSATITIKRPNGVALVTSAAMTSVATTALTRTYQYAYTVPTSPQGGNWTIEVNSKEGAENTISDDGVGTFPVSQASITLVKSSSIISDPINNTTRPKRIPGAVYQYSILATNSGQGSPNANTVAITDVVPSTTSLMCVSTLCSGGANPIIFTNGTPSSGLTYTYASHVTYSNQVSGGAPYTYVPVPDVNGYDANVRGIRIAPAGTMNASSGTAPHPSFTINFRMKIK